VSELQTSPFDTIESARDYIDLLIQAIEDTQRDVAEEIRLSASPSDERRVQALQLVSLNLTKLDGHISKCRRILNDLRTLRRLLLEERKPAASAQPASRTAGAA
jgi:hypothetical protein